MTPELQATIAAYLVSCYPEEGCGFIVHEAGAADTFIPCPNVSETPRGSFMIDVRLHVAIADQYELVALVHSHPDAWAHPSDADRVSCEAMGVRWIIASVLQHAGDGSPHVAAWEEFEPVDYRAPLEGRQFSHGVLDCYTLIQDWYRLERGIELPHFERRDGWWDDGKSDLYTDGFESAGFRTVPPGAPLQAGDVILMQIRSRNGTPNHGGVYLGGGKLLHHPYGRLSRVEVYGGMWAQYTRRVVRRTEDFTDAHDSPVRGNGTEVRSGPPTAA